MVRSLQSSHAAAKQCSLPPLRQAEEEDILVHEEVRKAYGTHREEEYRAGRKKEQNRAAGEKQKDHACVDGTASSSHKDSSVPKAEGPSVALVRGVEDIRLQLGQRSPLQMDGDDVEEVLHGDAAKRQNRKILKFVRSRLNEDASSVALFKQNSKLLVSGSMSSADFVQYLQNAFGTTATTKLVSEMVKLLQDETMRKSLLMACTTTTTTTSTRIDHAVVVTRSNTTTTTTHAAHMASAAVADGIATSSSALAEKEMEKAAPASSAVQKEVRNCVQLHPVGDTQMEEQAVNEETLRLRLLKFEASRQRGLQRRNNGPNEEDTTTTSVAVVQETASVVDPSAWLSLGDAPAAVVASTPPPLPSNVNCTSEDEQDGDSDWESESDHESTAVPDTDPVVAQSETFAETLHNIVWESTKHVSPETVAVAGSLPHEDDASATARTLSVDLEEVSETSRELQLTSEVRPGDDDNDGRNVMAPEPEEGRSFEPQQSGDDDDVVKVASCSNPDTAASSTELLLHSDPIADDACPPITKEQGIQTIGHGAEVGEKAPFFCLGKNTHEDASFIHSVAGEKAMMPPGAAHEEGTTESATACGGARRVDEWENDATRVESTSVSDDDHAEVTSSATFVGAECVEDAEGAACNVPPVPTRDVSEMGQGACSSSEDENIAEKEEEATEHECQDLRPAGIDNQVHLSVSIGVVMEECEKKAALLGSMIKGGNDPIVAAPTVVAPAEDATDAGNNKSASVVEGGDSDGDGDDNWSNVSSNPSLSTKKEVTCSPVGCVVM
jgi:hypothetical protein